MTVDARQHPQEMMAEVARIIDEWRYGPKLSETALSEIRVLTLAYESARSAEPVAWAVQLPGPGAAVRFETDTERYSDPANRYGGEWRPLYAHPTPEASDV